jgi:hypothetical protein
MGAVKFTVCTVCCTAVVDIAWWSNIITINVYNFTLVFMWILYILHSTSMEESFCAILVRNVKKRCTVPAAYKQNMWQRNKLQSLLDFLLSVCLLPLCGIPLFISLFHSTVIQNFENCTLKWLCCVVNLYNLLWAVTPSETCYDVTGMSMQLKMWEIRNEGVFLCNCKIIKFDLKFSISSINPSLFPLKTNVYY